MPAARVIRVHIANETRSRLSEFFVGCIVRVGFFRRIEKRGDNLDEMGRLRLDEEVEQFLH